MNVSFTRRIGSLCPEAPVRVGKPRPRSQVSSSVRAQSQSGAGPSSSSSFSHSNVSSTSSSAAQFTTSLPSSSRSPQPSQTEEQVTLYGEGCRLTVHRSGEFCLWRRDLSGLAADPTPSPPHPNPSPSLSSSPTTAVVDTWTVVSTGHITLPTHAASNWEFTVHRESTNSCEIKWGHGAVVEIAPVNRAVKRHPWTAGLEKGWTLTFKVQHEMMSMAEVCVDLDRSGHIFGGSHLMRQQWPLNQSSLEVGPFFSFDNGPNGVNTLVGNSWVSSSGLALHVNPETQYLHVGCNAPLTIEGAKRKLEKRTWAVGVQNLSREYLPRDAPLASAVSGLTTDGLLRIQARRNYSDPLMKHPLESWETVSDRIRDELTGTLTGTLEKIGSGIDHLIHTPANLVDGMRISPLFATLSSMGPDVEANREGLPSKQKWLSLTVALCASADVREATKLSLRTLPKPVGIPDPSVLVDPIWTTWAKYKTKVDQQKTLEFARDIVSRNLPHSVMEIDDRWQSAYGDIAFDPKKFPDPKAMVDELHKMGFKVTVWVMPFCEEASLAGQEGNKKGYFVQGDKVGWRLKPGQFRWWQPQPVQAIDFSNDEAVDWFVGRLKQFQKETGVDGFKFDAGEPCFLPKNFRTAKPLHHPSEYTRLYLNRVASHFQHGCSEVRTGSRTTNLALLTRMGDRFSSWSTSNGLRSLIPTLLTSSVLGFPFTLPDMIGGNAYGWITPSSELMIRWAQVSALMPSIQFSIAPWDFGPECEKATAAVLKLRTEELKEDLLALADNASRTLQPICRPMWWLDPSDVATHTINDQFALGDDIIVAPVVQEGQRVRDVYLPRGTWRCLSGDAKIEYAGGRWLLDVPAPLEVLLVFRRIQLYSKPTNSLLQSKFFD